MLVCACCAGDLLLRLLPKQSRIDTFLKKKKLTVGRELITDVSACVLDTCRNDV